MKTKVKPDAASTRDRAREALQGVPDSLDGLILHVDLSAARVAGPSFLDELIWIAACQRNAKGIHFHSVPLAAATAIDDSAREHGVSDRIKVDRRP